MKLHHIQTSQLALAVLLIATAFSSSSAFVPISIGRSLNGKQMSSSDVGRVLIHPVTLLQSASGDGDQESRTFNDARTDIKNLLTQRAIQSFLYLCTTVRDPHSGKWIEEFLQTRNQLDYHGTAAGYLERFGHSWDGPLLAMAEQPKDVIVVSAKRRGKGHGGWSKNNPYMEERFVEFKISIDPASLTHRILAVREQIAKEWFESDLEVLRTANNRILDSYFAQVRDRRSEEASTDAPAFERTVVNILELGGFNQPSSSSPYRKGNFDLLYNLCTQASIHRILRDMKEEDDSRNSHNYAWLRDFYVDRIDEYFDGDQPYGRADDFLDELLSVPLKISRDGNMVDPMGLAERIIQVRNDIVDEWKVQMQRVPQDHSEGIRRMLLEKQMESWGSSPSSMNSGGSTFQ